MGAIVIDGQAKLWDLQGRQNNFNIGHRRPWINDCEAKNCLALM
jgi:hypothetical protein